MKVLMTLNDFANICGYFYNANFDVNAPACPNNGYNCRHPNQGEAQDGVGCCFGWSCPLGEENERMYEADEEDCEEFGFDYEEGQYVIVNVSDNEYNPKTMHLPKQD
jgi:hypothetical protein